MSRARDREAAYVFSVTFERKQKLAYVFTFGGRCDIFFCCIHLYTHLLPLYSTIIVQTGHVGSTGALTKRMFIPYLVP